MSDEKASIGVFVCECGDRVAGVLDVPALTRQAGELPGVAWAEHAGYWCLPGGQARIRAVVAEQGLERVVIAGCAPRTHERLFRQALDGLNPALVSLTNLRDLCARPHRDDPAGAAAKARDQVAMAVAELAARQGSAPRVAHIAPRAVVIGGGLAGMTAALGLSDAGIPVTLVERQPTLGGSAWLQPDDREVAAMAERCVASASARSNIEVRTGARVVGVSGPVGHYQVVLSDGLTIEAGAIIVAVGGEPAAWPATDASHYAFILCDMTPGQSACAHACCPAALRRAAEIRRQKADSQVTLFFRELYTAGGAYDELVWEAQRLGVRFVRYPAGRAPQAVDHLIVTHDELTGREVRVPCDACIPVAPMAPNQEARELARLLRLPVDAAGFLADARVRLRPADRIERGIYVCGAAHYPCDAQRAVFEAYSAAARAAQHIRRERVISWAPPAVIDAARCNGCGDCLKVCPFMAVTLEARAGSPAVRPPTALPPLAVVDALTCTGCGNCVSVCPVKAAQVPTAYDEQLEAQIRAALARLGQYLIFACEWSGYSAAEVAGAAGLAYPAATRIIRLNCTGRLQPGLVLKALEMGAAGVLILGCAPGVCHFEQGNERCAAMFEQANALARLMGLDGRLKLEWLPPDDGARFAQVVADFAGQHPAETARERAA